MNTNFKAIFSALPRLIFAAEQAITTPGSGADKAAAVLAGVAPAIPVEAGPKVVPVVQSWIAELVALYNEVGLLKAVASTSTSPPGSTVAPASATQ